MSNDLRGYIYARRTQRVKEPSESDEHTDSGDEDPLASNEESQNKPGDDLFHTDEESHHSGSSDKGMHSLIINSKGSRNNVHGTRKRGHSG